ncbi:GNAT family N-acetyltransferase (plasmid) [Acinetobacter baumannii]
MNFLLNSEYSIRNACLSDIDRLIAIEKSASQAFLDIPKLAWVAESDTISRELHSELISNFYSIVAINKVDQIVGFLYSKKYKDDLYILEIDVDQSQQKKGIGKLLINYLINKGKNEGVKRITLTTFIDVIWNQQFYEKIGFETFIDNLPDYLADIIHKEISEGFLKETRCAMYLEIE